MNTIYIILFICLAIGVVFVIAYFLRRDYSLTTVEKALKEKNYKEAVDQALKYLKHRPSNFLVNKYLGEAYEGLAHYRHAIESYEKSLVELKNNFSPALKVEILLKLGNLYRSANRFNEALGYYKMVLDDSRKNPAALWNIAEILFDSKKYEASKFYLERFESVNPENNKTPMLLSKVYYNLGDYHKSIEQIGRINNASKFYSIIQMNEINLMLLLAYVTLDS